MRRVVKSSIFICSGNGPRLMLSSSVAYSYVCRHFQVSRLADASTGETAGIKDILSSIAHFITDRNSKVVHASLSGVVTDIWSRLGEASLSTLILWPIY